ncbi:MAG: right-handed parallel beta-helix repeat-containing protein [Alphaproteobacteria bacterium]|nr:right-handed parallel beta-helix repeat-containing protein [Alphaproteobacteria bacterium]
MRSLIPTLLLALTGCPALGAGALSHRLDQDNDGFENAELGGTDCNDLDPAVNPDAPERCDGIDNDCDHLFNEEDPSLEGADWYLDADHDGFGRASVHERSCKDLGATLVEMPGGAIAAWVHDDTDCDDTDATQHPGQEWDIDGDGDGWGKRIETRRLTQCLRPSGYVVKVPDGEEDDCDDVDAARNPGATEICDGRDNDCDDLEDGDPDLVGGRVFHDDLDGDGYGVDAADPPICADVVPAYKSPLGGDCDDTDPLVNPDTLEDWTDDVDQNCDGNMYDQDWDGDLHPPHGADCDDHDPNRFTGAPDICDGRWNDCATGDVGWTRDAEATGVWFQPFATEDEAVDWSHTLSIGGDVLITQRGSLWFCGAGPWYGRVQMRDLFDLRIEGWGDPVLDAEGHGSNILINPAVSIGTATIRGMTLTGGASSCLDVYVSNVIVEDSEFVDCVAAPGGAASTVADGGGARIRAAGMVEIRRSAFHDNHASRGGGAYVSAPDILIEDSTFVDNTADDDGGGLYLETEAPDGAETARLARVAVRRNDAARLADGMRSVGMPVSIMESTIADNDQIGWIAAGPVDHTIVQTTISGHLGAGLQLGMGASHTATCSPGLGGTPSRIDDNAVGVVLGSGTFVAEQGCAFPPAPTPNGVDVQIPGVGDYSLPPQRAHTCDASGCTP